MTDPAIPARPDDAPDASPLCVLGLALGTTKGCALVLELLGQGHLQPHADSSSII